MAETSRLDFLRQAGKLAVQGLKATVTGVDLVIDPNKPEPPPADPVPGEAPAPPSEPIGSIIGRRALAAGSHRMNGAERTDEGEALSAAELLAEVPYSLAVYPGAGAGLVREAVQVPGDLLPLTGDLEWESRGRDLVWLPLVMGCQTQLRPGVGRLTAVGGYRRSALVQFGAAAATADIWCALGDDLLHWLVPDQYRGRLLLEEPQKLRTQVEQQQVRLALLGGDDLDWALTLPGASVALEVQAADLPFVPIWGLFANGRAPALSVVADDQQVLAPVEELPALPEWLARVAG